MPTIFDIVLDDQLAAVYRDGQLWRSGSYDDIARWASTTDPSDGSYRRHVVDETVDVTVGWPDTFDAVLPWLL